MKYCEGCPINVQESCSYIDYSEKCPCTICLIKMICNKTCSDYILFQVKVYTKIYKKKVEGHNKVLPTFGRHTKQ